MFRDEHDGKLGEVKKCADLTTLTLDRLVHGSVKLELKGESMRKIQTLLTDGDQ
ncbi:ATP-binding protein [Arsenophonus endosymbiont of Aleurodicus floccissimus]|uniref:ATP-binding protein n=1 Tax=Arsenophonus endosymbiont of Aleurodicus floccissimus TaxID=2152761 RepID=UPI0021069EB8|nr:ATP-binding protein [Arsenophonus endosymbiont of Aleurodicus floccissimus]